MLAEFRAEAASELAAVRTDLRARGLCHTARGTGRDSALQVGIQFHEFCGWLYQDSGNCGAAMACTDTAHELAAELNDPRITSYVLMRKSNIATDANQADRAVGLANAALAAEGELTPRLRAIALRQKANAHALLGEHDEFARARDAAHVQAAAGMSQHEPDTAGYCTPSYVEMEAGAALVRLGRPAQAVPIFEESRSHWPEGNQRDHMLCQARLASAYASAGEPAAACAAAAHILGAAVNITSARVAAELDCLRHHLARWAGNPDVADLQALLAARQGQARLAAGRTRL
jgi:hypothetical protein